MDQKFVKYSDNGMVDVDASVAAFTAALSEYAANQRSTLVDIARATDEVWDSNPALKNIPLGSLATEVAIRLGATIAERPAVEKKVEEYVKSATSKFKVQRKTGVSRVVPDTSAAAE